MRDDFPSLRVNDDAPRQSDVHGGNQGLKANPVRFFHERGQTGPRQADIGGHIFQQVIGRRAQSAAAGLTLKIHVRQWLANPIRHEQFVVRPGFQGDRD